MEKKSYYLILFLLTLAESTRIRPRNNGSERISKKESHLRIEKSLRAKGNVLESLFNVYDPSFLSVVWPKISNGVHISVEESCWEDLSVFFGDLSEGRLWALNVADASGRYQGGAFAGNRYWLGSKHHCLVLNNEAKSSSHDGNQFLGPAVGLRKERYHDGDHEWKLTHTKSTELSDNPPFHLGFNVARVLLTIMNSATPQPFDITIGLCLPRSCSKRDISSLLTFSIMLNDNLKSNKTVPRIAKIASLRQVTEHYSIKHDLGAILLLSVTLFLLLLSITATVIEINIIKCKRGSKSISFDLQKYNNTDTISKLHDKVKKQIDERIESDVADNEVLSKNNVNHRNNINLLAMKNVNPNITPSITLDVVGVERATGSCTRCGKYRRQCNNPRQVNNLTACPRVKYSSAASLNTEEKKTSLIKRLLFCFSLRYSWSRIFNTNTANKDLSVIHVWRIIATLWLIFVHVSVIVDYVSVNSGGVNEAENIYNILNTGTMAFDTLFLVSGLFSSHHFFYLKSQYTVEELVGFDGTWGHILQYICFITNRAVRLLPSYLYAIFLSAVVARVSRATSSLALPDGDHQNCETYWWRNILYVTTFYPAEERCMQVSWYLSTESQLHVAGALVCAVGGGRRRRPLLALAGAALLAAAAADLAGAYTDYSLIRPGAYNIYSIIIERPWARVLPYFVGVVIGWLTHKMQGALKISKTAWWCAWCSSAAALAAAAAAAAAALAAGRAWPGAALHACCPLALLAPALYAASHHAESVRRMVQSRMVAALSRLWYGAALLHAPAARALLLHSDVALCSHTLCIWSYFAGTASLTLLGAFALALLVEMPFCSVLRRLSDYANT
ncbi:uncharacterized protein LOC113522872 [Galleria mellonella]|uniref:Uncharacterized protein LOC113522872 n=1 Tax=Galleria mellonella TaxID=7137 RepID=A0ABM3N5E8_GALME|nr:uncharacterized protein LOC113522872 [Galleria mellonella]